MRFFEKFFENRKTGELDESSVEWAVCCPFPHYDENGSPYYEEIPSAHVNLEKRVFHCKVCGEGMSEAVFFQKINPGMSYGEAVNTLTTNIHKVDKYNAYIDALKNSPPANKLVNQIGLAGVADELKLGFDGQGITFPVYVYGELLDVRTYRPNGKPKVKSLKGATTYIFPFDLWVNDPRPTLLCAGEKDCAIARAKGFNAITFTGGEGSFPKLFKYSFRDRKVYVIYDNDFAGKKGSEKVATLLKECGAQPYVVTGHYDVCTGKGEDLWDFFMKYEKSAEDLKAILNQTKPFSQESYERVRNEHYPLIRLEQSIDGKYSKRIVSSRVAVIATYEAGFRCPEVVEICLIDKETNTPIKTIQWSLTEDNVHDLLRLIEVKEEEQRKFFYTYAMSRLNYDKKLHRLSIRIASTRPVFKAVVTDDTETELIENMEADYRPFELPVYILDHRLHDGEKYRIFYQPCTHPLQGQKVVGIVTKAEESDNSVNRFKMTPNTKNTLTCFQGSVEKKMEELYERAKAFIGAELNKTIFYTAELFFHTPLYFNFAGRTERAYLDVILAGESRTGKSHTLKKLIEKYQLGTIVSLKTATEAGLIGGSNKEGNGGYKTRIGVLPRNHKGAVIFEEFSGGGRDIIKKLTEIRSSNKVRLQRVSGTTVADCMVRMLAISNQATKDGVTIPLRRYANGIEVFLELVGAAEDIARYDFCVLVDKPSKYISPTTKVESEPYPDESYLNRIRWIWSRKPEQIYFSPEVEEHIVSLADHLNELYDCHINFFGTEAWKKLARVAIAVAACTASMDETGEKVVVEKSHAEWAYRFLRSCYDNDLFKLPQYVEEERKYRRCDNEVVLIVEDLYRRHTTLIKALDTGTGFTLKQLEAISGLAKEDFNRVYNRLYGCYLIDYKNNQINPTERFRIAMSRINRNTRLKRTGEE